MAYAPVGFSEIRNEDHYYVDKTGFAQRLIEQGKYYFLSRPRRFGKSLLVDTLKELFEGNEPLFRYPVIRREGFQVKQKRAVAAM